MCVYVQARGFSPSGHTARGFTSRTARQLLTQSGALAQLRPPCSQHFRSSLVTHVGDISYPAIRSSASNHPQARPALADPPKVSPRRGACLPRRGACSRRREVREVAHCRQRSPLSSQAEPAFSTLSSSQAPVPPYAPFTVAARIHSRRPPPPASTRPLPPSRAAPSRAAPSRAAPSLDGSLRTEALGTAPDRCIAGGHVAQHGARRSSRRWRVQRVARHSPSAAVWRSNRTNISRPSRL